MGEIPVSNEMCNDLLVQKIRYKVQYFVSVRVCHIYFVMTS